MASLKATVRKLHRHHSKAHVFFLGFVVVATLAVAIGLRYYALEPLRLGDSSMYPRFHDKDILWMCKHKKCTEKIKADNIVWASLRNKETMVRRVAAKPGEEVAISGVGRLKVNGRKFKWHDENVFIESRSFYVPKKGDTLWFEKLNDVEEDYAIGILQDQKRKFFIESSLWQGEDSVSLEKIGASKLGNSPVSIQMINTLPWQDRYLLELQVFKRENGSDPFKIKRKFFNASDSSQIEYVVAKDDYYYLVCEKGAHCPDSREHGYFPKKRIMGKYVNSPRNLWLKIQPYVQKIMKLWLE